MNSPYYARRCYGTTTQFLWERARHGAHWWPGAIAYRPAHDH